MSNIIIQIAVIALLFVIAGIITRFIIKKYLNKVIENTQWKWDDLIIEHIIRYIILWFFLGGLYFAFQTVTLENNVSQLLNRIVALCFVITISLAVFRIVSSVAEHYSEVSQGRIQSTTIFVNMTKLIVLILAVLVIFQSLGIKIAPLLTALGVGGLAVALALQDTLSNLFAGLHIIFAGQIRVGDFVMLDSGQKGEVIDITWRNSSIKTRGNNMIVIPNSKLAQAIILNFDLNKKDIIVKIDIGVAYDSDLDKVERIALQTAENTLKTIDGGAKDFEPVIRFHTFNDSSIDFTVIMMVEDYPSQFLVKHEFIKTIHKRFNEENITIPFPMRTVQMEKNKE